MKIAILMLTYNAPRYVWKTLVSLKDTKDTVDYELIVVDNKSKNVTRWILKWLKKKGCIDILYFNNHNALFAKGNNLASKLVSDDVTHYLLLNSDIEIKSSDWLEKLVELHSTEGITALGAVMKDPIRADGYCMLIDRYLYDKYLLDENFEWWWSVTKLESEVLKCGLPVRAVKEHEKLLHHFGGRSGKGYKDAKGMDIDINEVISWFQEKNDLIMIYDTIE